MGNVGHEGTDSYLPREGWIENTTPVVLTSRIIRARFREIMETGKSVSLLSYFRRQLWKKDITIEEIQRIIALPVVERHMKEMGIIADQEYLYFPAGWNTKKKDPFWSSLLLDEADFSELPPSSKGWE